jgi:hypothetical protein
MTEHGKQLQATADGQIAELIDLVSTVDEATLRLPCPGREKLGDGTVAASMRHTADNYEWIRAFVQVSDGMSGAHGATRQGGHRVPRFLRALGHGAADHAEPGTARGQHEDHYAAANIDPGAVVRQLSASRETLGRIGELTDSQLDAVPPNGSFRFCDGQRTLEQVLASLLKHQHHQVDALKTALA